MPFFLRKIPKALRPALLAPAVFFLVLLFLLLSPFPELRSFKKRAYSVDYVDRNGTLLFVSPLEDGLRREFTPLSQIPDVVRDTFVEAEDRKFYAHAGIDVLSVARALFQNASESRTVSGASTITMQLARIISPSPERNVRAKLKDSLNALRLEARLPKRRILELYLNNVPFGNNVEGVSSAARFYFGKDVGALSAEEAALLSVVPRRPAKYNPADNPENCARAAAELRPGGRPSGFGALLSAARSARKHPWPFFMPHYIRFVSKDADAKATRVSLSADLDVQLFVEGQIRELLRRGLGSRIENAAAVVIENRTGRVLAWVGSQGFFDEDGGGQIDGVLVRNQVGSSMKPFLYALALERGFRANDALPDVPVEFLVGAGDDRFNSYRPENFNNRFNGPVLFRNALASSLNIPAVYLLSKIGVEDYLCCLLALGFDSLRATGARAGMGLALGAGEVSLLELARAFTVFANDGVLHPLEFEDAGERRVFSERTARVICDMLSDKRARVTGFGYSQTYETAYPSIFKTGTANQYQDIVALGSTAEFTVGVWMGNFNGNTVVGKTGSSFPALVAKNTLDMLTGGTSPAFAEPPLQKERVCALSGMAAGPDCPSSVREYVDGALSGPDGRCSWHRRGADGGIETVFPALYQEWLSKDFFGASIDYKSEPLRIVSPLDGSVFYRSGLNGELQKIPVEIIGGMADIPEITVRYDSEMFAVPRPFSLAVPVEKGRHVIRAEFGGERDEVSFTVE